MADSYLLDTCVCLHLIKNTATGEFIDREYRLSEERGRAFLSIVTHGEAATLAAVNNWGEDRRAALALMLDSLPSIDIGHEDIIRAYVEIEVYNHHRPEGSIKMGKNDLWIAATARAAKATLLTLDKDFEHLPQEIVRYVRIPMKTRQDGTG